MPFDVGGPEILIIILIAALLFGAKKIPELARSMGKASSEFKKGLKEGAEEPTEPSRQTGSAGAPSSTPQDVS